MNRTTQLKGLRPPIPTIVETATTSSAELFQNQALRPILKFQNDLLLATFRHYITLRKGQYYQLSKEKRLPYIAQAIHKDLKFKNLLSGMVIGHFSVTEWQTYTENERELRKRLTNLLTQRIQDQFQDL